MLRAAACAQGVTRHRAYAVDDGRPVIDEDAARLGDRGLRRPMDILIGDLEIVDPGVGAVLPAGEPAPFLGIDQAQRFARGTAAVEVLAALVAILDGKFEQIGRASCRERVWQYV